MRYLLGMRDLGKMSRSFETRLLDGDLYFIAEVGLNHNGSIDMAHQLIEVAASSGAQAVKFQKRTVSQLAIKSVLDAPDSRFPSLGSTYRELRERHEFTLEEFLTLRDHAESLGLDFLVTPFDEIALNLVMNLQPVGIKVASHSLTNLPLLTAIAQTAKCLVVSTGMSTLEEVRHAVRLLQDVNTRFVLMHCVSSYPTSDEDLNLRVISTMSQEFGVHIGYSGHEAKELPTLVAIALGARVIERHITLSRELEGFDHKLSLEPQELKDLIQQAQRVIRMLGSGSKRLLPSEGVARDKYNVSMVSSREIRAGERLEISDITWKNPGIGIPPKELSSYLGRRISRDISADTLLSEADFHE
jgi:sialic acid synthase SpsE